MTNIRKVRELSERKKLGTLLEKAILALWRRYIILQQAGVAVIGENSRNQSWKCSAKSLRNKQDVHAEIYDPGDLSDIYYNKELKPFVPEDVGVYIGTNGSHEVQLMSITCVAIVMCEVYV